MTMKQHITKEQWDELSETQKEMFWIKVSPFILERDELPSLTNIIEFLGEERLEDLFTINNGGGCDDGRCCIDYGPSIERVSKGSPAIDVLFASVKAELPKT